jgi:subtilisin family serine protease
MKRFVIFGCFLVCASMLFAEQTTLYRVILTDKGNSPCSIDQPEEFLSPKSIERRLHQGFEINETDLPIDPAYFQDLTATGATIRTYSKWVSTVVVKASSESIVNAIRELPFVSDVYPVFIGNVTKSVQKNENLSDDTKNPPSSIENYGYGYGQIQVNNGFLLHQAGFKGAGKTIAVLDGGFYNADRIDYFDQSHILGVKNFTHEGDNPFRDNLDHGTMTLSCMLSKKENVLIGTAPAANYYLFKTEVNQSEYPVEEDYWVAALEYADSLGVDIISSSLGYYAFDTPSMNHTQLQLNGRSIPISKAASMAAAKGMIVVNSAGNEAIGSWQKIIFPSDAANILCVGAVQRDSIRSYFSSLGYSSDGRVKPDVMAMGSNVAVVRYTTGLTYANGTSFACPIMAGLTACLWNALPQLTSLQILSLMRENADRFQNPNVEYGYGIANVYQSYLEGRNISTTISSVKTSGYPYLTITSDQIRLKEGLDYSQAFLVVYTGMGIEILNNRHSPEFIDISRLNKGIYIAYLYYGDKRYSVKFMK